MNSTIQSDSEMAAAITRAASRQTDLTIRYLVDTDMVADAYRTYGYFRWVDDCLDEDALQRPERLAFVSRQQNLMEACYRGEQPGSLKAQETMLVNLIAHDCTPASGLQTYIRNMMAVMAFDAERRGRLISEHELEVYTAWLASAVTEAMHYFIGHCCTTPHCEARYQAVSGAHITHMLRDAVEDSEAGYFNIPQEVISAHQIKPWDVSAPAYRAWVKERVLEARHCFELGKKYLSQVESLRCRLAGYAYTHRFEVVLNSIEREGFLLRRQYPERKESGRVIETIGQAVWMALRYQRLPFFSSVSSHQVHS
jgi:phytoene/squalene synthetase